MNPPMVAILFLDQLVSLYVGGTNYIVMYEEVEKRKEEALEVSMTFQTTECSGRESFSYIDYNSGQ